MDRSSRLLSVSLVHRRCPPRSVPTWKRAHGLPAALRAEGPSQTPPVKPSSGSTKVCPSPQQPRLAKRLSSLFMLLCPNVSCSQPGQHPPIQNLPGYEITSLLATRGPRGSLCLKHCTPGTNLAITLLPFPLGKSDSFKPKVAELPIPTSLWNQIFSKNTY